MITLDRVRELIPALAGRRVMVIGDVMADRYVLTEPARLSREAPVMVARYQDEELIPGGAANALNNLLALGAEVVPVALAGRDEHGASLVRHFDERGVDTDGIIQVDGHRTVTKTRFMVGDPNRTKQQVLRIDREPDGPPSAEAARAVLEAVRQRVGSTDAVLFSDYGYDTVSGPVVDAVRGTAGDRIATVDSRYRIRSFRGLTLATPNEHEVEAAVGYPLRTDEDLDRAGRSLLQEMEAPALLVTRGNRGMALFVAGAARTDIPATGTHEVTDVSGAGDTVIAVTTLALAAGARAVEAAALANLAAGVVVMKVGAATCSPEELTAAAESYL